MWDWLPVLPQKDYEEWLCRRTVNKQATLLLKTKRGHRGDRASSTHAYFAAVGHSVGQSVGRLGRLRAADYDKKLNRLMMNISYCAHCRDQIHFLSKIIVHPFAVSIYHLRVVVVCCKLHISHFIWSRSLFRIVAQNWFFKDTLL